MRYYLMLALLAITSFSVAAANKDSEVPEAVTKTAKHIQKLLKKDDSASVSVGLSPIAGLYEAKIDSVVVYITMDGSHFLAGNLYETDTGVNLTDESLSGWRKSLLDELDEKEMVVFAPKEETKYTINVFTDVDCHYCAKLHQEVATLNEAGVKVRYLAFPRAGVGSPTYDKMVSVWCAKDQQKAMTAAKARQPVEKAECNNPIASQYELGQRMGISGTPALVFSDGDVVPGYMSARNLIVYLIQKSAGLR
jgi:thiol:disulfide interchange protein DsbC